ncbi:PEP-CTERM sorting domain-containing protein [Pseudoduganella sp. UC29_106]|uniref:PEP-CTERM sorting domain-containing protein n=1 Tax=Pseudoduganella sp. UC29_106 TaxID=3374553 RepID=UPI0037568277
MLVHHPLGAVPIDINVEEEMKISQRIASIFKNGAMVGTIAGYLLCATANAVPVSVTVDENGVGIGTTGPGTLHADPGPGGLSSVLTYGLPFQTVTGDVFLTDNGLILDVVRFNGTTIAFYSDNVDGADSLADTPSPPLSFYTNVVSIPELGTETDNGAFYTPTAGQPGYISSDFQVTYHFISDGSAAVPEPSEIALFALGLGCLIGLKRKPG